MRTIYIAQNQFFIHHNQHRFMCCKTDGQWELMLKAEGYSTVQKFAPDGTDILPETVETWIEENYA